MPDINKMYSWAVNTCNANNVGYSQTYRNQKTVNGITYYDCSSFVNYALLAGGFTTPGYAPSNNAFTTYTMEQVLLNLGFKKITNDVIMAGDIGVSDSHTEICYTGGTGSAVFMGAHGSSYPLAQQVSISTYTRTFPRIYRYGDGGASGYGVSPYVAAAIAGNMWQESGLSPGIWENLSPGEPTSLLKGYGLGLWTNTGGDPHGRLYQLCTWLDANGYARDDGNGQLAFLVHENVWYTNSAYPFNNLNDFLTSNSTDIAMLTHAYNLCWEGIHDSSWDARVTYAQQCLSYINAHANDAAITKWYNGNTYLPNNQRLNNAVMLFRFLSAGGGGGGVKERGRMPLWFYMRKL